MEHKHAGHQVNMSALMSAPMVVIELIVMRMMYQDGRLNALIVLASVLVGGAMFFFIRQQAGIGDRQFLRSMIPHHAGAILMCRQASLEDPELKVLCQGIMSSQQREIDQMTTKLRALQ